MMHLADYIDAVTAEKFKENFETIVQGLNDDYTFMIVTPQEGEAVLMMTLREFNSFREKLYFLSQYKKRIEPDDDDGEYLKNMELSVKNTMDKLLEIEQKAIERTHA